MHSDWTTIDTFWEGFESDYEPIFASTSLRDLPASSVADEWLIVDTYWDGYVAHQVPKHDQLEDLVTAVRDRWNDPASVFDTDPLSANWGSGSTHEGPLRTTCDEEDWSQWLAHLLRTSTGPFVEALVGLPNTPPERVRREVVFSDSTSTRRIDILVEYPETAVSIEVKNGDSNYRKTPETAGLIEREGNRKWTHILLLQKANQPRLHRTFGDDLITGEQTRPTIQSGDRPPVEVRYWEDVSHTLRWMLTAGHEPDSHWQASAYLFITLIEQRILDLHSIEHITSKEDGDSTSSSRELSRLVAVTPERQINYLRTLLAEEPIHE